jgi:quercetin dioxygenase-like cupin family protein
MGEAGILVRRTGLAFQSSRGAIMRAIAAVLLAGVAITVGPSAAQAQATGLGRTDLLSKDLSVPGREVKQVMVDFPRGVNAPRHSHPGEEIAFVAQGVLEYQIDGQPPVRLSAGQSIFLPAGAVHSAKNVGTGEAKELATYIVEKGKPLVVLAK